MLFGRFFRELKDIGKTFVEDVKYEIEDVAEPVEELSEEALEFLRDLLGQ